LEVVVGRKAGSYLVVFLLTAASLAAQWLNYPTPGIPRTPDGKPNLTPPAPRKPDGKPDLSGIWQADGNPYVRDMENPSFIPERQAMRRPRSTPKSACLPPDLSSIPASPFKIMHSGGTLAILSEYEVFRQIFLDGRPLPTEILGPTWLGYSVGRWDGDTLVVDSAGFDDQMGIIGGRIGGLRLGPLPHTDALHVIERFHRRDFGHMEIQFTISDPQV
jgi:hypothetical protein